MRRPATVQAMQSTRRCQCQPELLIFVAGVDVPCKAIPEKGAGHVPLNRPLMTLSRVYVNPSTGVGPAAADLVPFATILLSPKGSSNETADSRHSTTTSEKLGGASLLVRASSSAARNTLFGGFRETESSSSDVCPISSDPCLQSFVGMSQCSGTGSWDVCCEYVQAWNDEQCWDRDVGRPLSNSMPAITPALVQLLGRVCGAE